MRRGAWLSSVAVVACATGAAQACINTYSPQIKYLLIKDQREQAVRQVKRLEHEYERDKSLENTNDLAVARIYFGRYDEAIALLKELERRHPGRAATAANIGTAFELTGRDEAALQWIREGVRRDPREHDGSEWVHVRILEAKLASKKDSAWLDRHSIVGLSFGDGPRPSEPALAVDHLGKEHSHAESRRSISYQIDERIVFVKPPDRIVADLYKTAGDLGAWLYVNDVSKQLARNWFRTIEAMYDGARKYGHPQRALIDSRLADLRRLEAERGAALKTP